MFNISGMLFRTTRIRAISEIRLKTTKPFLAYEDIPQPKSFPLIGTKLDLIAAGSGAKLHEYINRRHQELGTIFREKIGETEIIFVSDPQLIKEVFLRLEGKYPEHIVPEPWTLYEKLYGSTRGLFFMHGEEWYYNRKIMNKLVLKESSESWLEPSITEVITKFINTWKKRAEKGSITPESETEFYRLSIEVLLGVLLGSNSSMKRTSYHDELLTIFAGEVKKIFAYTTKLYALPVSLCQRLNLKVWRDFKESVDISLNLANKLVKEIMAASDLGDGLIQKLQAENMKEENISRIVADFVIAAGDTTSYTLLWTLYLLAKNKGTLEELQMVNNDNMAKYVLKESMRLYPVAPFLTRILSQDFSLGPYCVEKSVCLGGRQ